MGIYHSRQLAFAGAIQQGKVSGSREGYAIPSWFRGIPPERVGLDGKYDHCGLQKRVEAAFHECFEAAELAQLSISQRGRVVILQGNVASRDMLQRLVKIAERAEGAIRVEAYSVVLQDEVAVLNERIHQEYLV